MVSNDRASDQSMGHLCYLRERAAAVFVGFDCRVEKNRPFSTGVRELFSGFGEERRKELCRRAKNMCDIRSRSLCWVHSVLEFSVDVIKAVLHNTADQAYSIFLKNGYERAHL